MVLLLITSQLGKQKEDKVGQHLQFANARSQKTRLRRVYKTGLLSEGGAFPCRCGKSPFILH